MGKSSEEDELVYHMSVNGRTNGLVSQQSDHHEPTDRLGTAPERTRTQATFALPLRISQSQR